LVGGFMHALFVFRLISCTKYWLLSSNITGASTSSWERKGRRKEE
jgi:hypothetical protein